MYVNRRYSQPIHISNVLCIIQVRRLLLLLLLQLCFFYLLWFSSFSFLVCSIFFSPRSLLHCTECAMRLLLIVCYFVNSSVSLCFSFISISTGDVEHHTSLLPQLVARMDSKINGDGNSANSCMRCTRSQANDIISSSSNNSNKKHNKTNASKKKEPQFETSLFIVKMALNFLIWHNNFAYTLCTSKPLNTKHVYIFIGFLSTFIPLVLPFSRLWYVRNK